METCRHRGRSQFSENSPGLLTTTSKIPMITPVDRNSAKIVKVDTVVVHKIRRSRSLVLKRYRTSLESSCQRYHTSPLMSNKKVYEFELDHFKIQDRSTPIDDNDLGGLYAKNLDIQRKYVRCILINTVYYLRGRYINLRLTCFSNRKYQFYV